MISLDQVYLLEQKVESAVAKIQQLQAENDALRKKCSELTNALSSKTEQLSSFENDQSAIENGIKKALDRLNAIENTVLKTVGQVAPAAPVAAPVVPQQEKPLQTPVQVQEPAVVPQETIPEEPSVSETLTNNEPLIPSFDTMRSFEEPEQEAEPISPVNNSFIPFSDMPESDDSDIQDEDESSDGLGFDIF